MLDKLLYNLWDCTLTFFFLTLLLFGVLLVAVGIATFAVWDFNLFQALVGWGLFRFSAVIGLILTTIWFFKEGHLEYDYHVPNKDWLKNGKWF